MAIYQLLSMGYRIWKRGDCYKLLPELWILWCCNCGLKPWVSWPYLRFGLGFMRFSMILRQILHWPTSMMIWWFLNSVPQNRLLDAINSLIQEWKSKHGEVALSVDMSHRGNPLQLSYVGKFHKAPRKTKVIQPSDILTIVQSSLQSHIFQAMNVIWHQIRGAGIGSHTSPTISNLAVTLIERAWTQSYEEILTAPSFPFLAICYVDNRYIIFPEEMIQDLSIQTLAQTDFYQHPVELETVTTNELLGFIVDSKLRTIQYKLPEPWQIRDFVSAGSLRLRLSGLQSRCHLISRYTYPCTGCPDRIHSLIHLCIAKGFPSSDCYKAIRKLNKKDTADFSH